MPAGGPARTSLHRRSISEKHPIFGHLTHNLLTVILLGVGGRRAVLIEQVEAIRRRYGRVAFDDPGTGILRETVYDASVPVWLSAVALRIRFEESGPPAAETP